LDEKREAYFELYLKRRQGGMPENLTIPWLKDLLKADGFDAHIDDGKQQYA
jgi:hypothetical protein